MIISFPLSICINKQKSTMQLGMLNEVRIQIWFDTFDIQIWDYWVTTIKKWSSVADVSDKLIISLKKYINICT